MRTKILTLMLVAMLACFSGQVRSQEPFVIPPIPVQLEKAVPVATKVPPVESLPQVVYGEPSCCARCTQQCACQKHTRIVCEMKKVKKTVFDCECEDVCGLLPSSMLPDSLFGISLWGHKKTGCGEAGCGDCAAGCCTKAPVATHCRTRKVLVQKTITVEVPVYKCVVEFCCDSCGGAIDSAGSEKSPVADAKSEDVPHVATLPRNQSSYGE
ncbi:hypothetical protein AB1L30_06905 [Bremerella sp. JC817]|uniref:hypothetical protein n=1 Tax=Bremerella sp. JC817 TaxID=3231756 RepID=UPI00345A295A